MRAAFIDSINKYKGQFELDPAEDKVELLADFRELIQAENDRLHLVGPASTEEFVIRHVLESLTLLEFLPENISFADIGPGAGFPSIPCLIVREDLRAVLIESKTKKAEFLRKAVGKFGLENRVEIVHKQFAEAPSPNVSYVTCRALDKFAKHLPKLLSWSGAAKFRFFGGNALREALEKAGRKFEEKLIPGSEKRYLFVE